MRYAIQILLWLAPLAVMAQKPVVTAVVNAGSYSTGPLTPGMLVAVFGTNIGPSPLVNLAVGPNGRLVTELQTTRVLFDGVAAPLIYASAGQTAAIVPYATAGRGSTMVQVEYQGQLSDPLARPIAAINPGIFSLDSSGTGGGAIINPNGTINSATNPARPGDVVLVYLTGEGLLRQPVADGAIATAALFSEAVYTAEIGGVAAALSYTGAAPGNAFGFAQANITIPATLSAGGNMPLVLRSGGVSSQAGLTVAVTTPAPVTMTSVFLIHGINQQASDMNALRGTLTGPNGLNPMQFTVDAAFDFSDCTQRTSCPATCTMSSGAQRLAQHIIARNPPGDVVLVGYSLGGLVARDLLANNWSNVLGRYKIRLVTIGSPMLGYPFTSLDPLASCGTLLREMDGNWRNLTAGMPQLSSYLTDITNRWRNTAFPGMGTWLAATGRFCGNATRGSTGCRDANPRSDGVVCDDSAAYNITTPAGTAPSRRWQDPSNVYAHTSSQFGFLIFGCNATVGTNLILSDPPPGPLLNEVLAAIQGTAPPALPSSVPDSWQILSLDIEAQRDFVRTAIMAGFPDSMAEPLAVLIRNRSAVAVPMLEAFIAAETDRSTLLVAKAAEWIAFAGDAEAAVAIERLGRLDERFAPLTSRAFQHAVHLEKR